MGLIENKGRISLYVSNNGIKFTLILTMKDYNHPGNSLAHKFCSRDHSYNHSYDWSTSHAALASALQCFHASYDREVMHYICT